VLGLPAEILEHGAHLVAVHRLRGHDAVQLSAARAADPGCATVACFDGRLRNAAAAEGFTLVP